MESRLDKWLTRGGALVLILGGATALYDWGEKRVAPANATTGVPPVGSGAWWPDIGRWLLLALTVAVLAALMYRAHQERTKAKTRLANPPPAADQEFIPLDPAADFRVRYGKQVVRDIKTLFYGVASTNPPTLRLLFSEMFVSRLQFPQEGGPIRTCNDRLAEACKILLDAMEADIDIPQLERRLRTYEETTIVENWEKFAWLLKVTMEKAVKWQRTVWRFIEKYPVGVRPGDDEAFEAWRTLRNNLTNALKTMEPDLEAAGYGLEKTEAWALVQRPRP